MGRLPRQSQARPPGVNSRCSVLDTATPLIARLLRLSLSTAFSSSKTYKHNYSRSILLRLLADRTNGRDMLQCCVRRRRLRL